MNSETYKKRYARDSSPGWDAIDKHLAARLDLAEPDFHFGTVHRFALGGPDPLDGISVYIRRNPDHLHFVSYGLSSLYYDDDAADGEFSGWGFELTFRLAFDVFELPQEASGVPHWPMGLMQNLARYVFSSKTWFEHGHYIDANGPIRAGSSTDKTAIVFCNDPELVSTDTPHGRLDFLQIIGITAGELGDLQTKSISPQALIDKKAVSHPLLITALVEK
ncbi:suppressor of fused domain protein [Albibacillus kandeliae]|uniref:suppressor of fused domain protein n=2 Tax=Albibacillus kandeliae TaxID=2174228 RepID=UPI000D685750|nr:suppressor of fused domain protein [Albibacillus kandeliae]